MSDNLASNPDQPPVARADHRGADCLRPVLLHRRYTCHAEGSVLVCFGNTKVLCTASVEDKVPGFLRGAGQGWVTAEYGMLPRSTHTRSDREAARGKQSGRTLEIQRLIGRCLRAVVDLKALGERTITVDCDVLQADGGTRTASVTGACLAVYDALMTAAGQLSDTDAAVRLRSAFREPVAAVSVGMVHGKPLLDLDYAEDSGCETDMNVAMLGSGGMIELQGTAEGAPFSRQDLQALLDLASHGIGQLHALQRRLIEDQGALQAGLGV